MGGQVTPQGIEAYLPIVQRVKGTSPAGAVGTVDIPVGDCGAVTDGAQRGNGEPVFGPGVLVAAEGTWAASGEVVQDQGDGRTGGVRGTATVAGAVAADLMDGAVHANKVGRTTDGDPLAVLPGLVARAGRAGLGRSSD